MERFRLSEAGGVPSGIYLLVKEGVVVYVGKSENVFSRVSVHWEQLRRAKAGLTVSWRNLAKKKLIEFDEVELIPLPIGNLDKEEERLIQVYRPEHNVFLKKLRFAEGYEKSEKFAELRATKERPLKIPRFIRERNASYVTSKVYNSTVEETEGVTL